MVGNIGPHAFEISANVKARIYLTRKMTDEVALEKLNRNGLELLTEPTAKRSMHSHKDTKPYSLYI